MLIRRSARPGTGDQQVGSSPHIDLAHAADFRVGALEVEPSTLQVRFAGSSRTVEPRVMQALVLLANERGKVVSRDRLIECCWGGRAVSEDAINRCIAKVRRLGVDCGGFELETIPRVGYRLLEESKKSQFAGSKPVLRRWPVRLGAVLLLLVAGGLLWAWQSRRAPEAPQIAVAGFKALNEGPDAQFYANSVTDAVSDALVAMGARVTPAEAPIRTLDDAARRGVALIIGGTVRKQGDTIRVTATIQSGTTGTTLITKEVEAPASDAALLPDRVAGSLAPMEWLWIAESRFERDPSVTEQILRIVDDWGGATAPWSMSRDLARANPGSASAQVVFAAATANALPVIPAEQRSTVVAEGRNAARRASELQPEFGYILPCELTPPGVLTAQCDKALRGAVAADPEPPYASVIFAGQLGDTGRIREADTMIAGAVADSPYDSIRLSLRMFTLQMERPADREGELPAIRARARRYAPDALSDELQYLAAIANGNVRAAETMLNDPSTGDRIDSGGGKDIDNAVLRAVQSRAVGDAAAARNKCLPPPPEWIPPGTAYQTCIVGLTMLGDLGSAFRLAQLGYPNIECCTPAEREKRWLAGGGQNYPHYVFWGSAMAPFRDDPRFITVARNTGLLSYWKSGHPSATSWGSAEVTWR
jgi:DNA-binding winged helix-turn-helix (wHTH) protein/TolB-like protein